jgi:hypothetical protein
MYRHGFEMDKWEQWVKPSEPELGGHIIPFYSDEERPFEWEETRQNPHRQRPTDKNSQHTWTTRKKTRFLLHVVCPRRGRHKAVGNGTGEGVLSHVF